MAHTFLKGFSASKMSPSNLSKRRSKQGPGTLDSGGFHMSLLVQLTISVYSPGLCYVLLCGIPFANKTLNPTNVRFRLKARGLLLA